MLSQDLGGNSSDCGQSLFLRSEGHYFSVPQPLVERNVSKRALMGFGGKQANLPCPFSSIPSELLLPSFLPGLCWIPLTS